MGESISSLGGRPWASATWGLKLPKSSSLAAREKTPPASQCSKVRPALEIWENVHKASVLRLFFHLSPAGIDDKSFYDIYDILCIFQTRNTLMHYDTFTSCSNAVMAAMKGSTAAKE